MSNRPTSCKAAFMYGLFNLKIEDLDIPPLKPNQVLIKLKVCGICASVVIECSGHDAGIASIFEVAGHSARVGLVGYSIGRMVPVEIGKVIWKTLSLTGSGGTKTWFPQTIRFMSKIKDKYDFSALNLHHYDFFDLADAMDLACHHKDIARKIMLTFQD